MRKIILALAVSLDGYIARENGAVNWLKTEDLTEAAGESSKFFKSVDTIFLGRKTYEKGLEMTGGDMKMYGDVKLYVFTRTTQTSEHENLQFVSENAEEFVKDLKRQSGKNIWLMGGGDLAKTFFEENLIDEIILGIQPTILGFGIPLFLPRDKQIDLELTNVKTRNSGSVQISYRVKG
ncbi:MAG: dihydrofolate reductase family protein [Acidobacteriota bacterium]|nr:dihydrofolate reductase family protein [Acidobacteriota bacterium]